MWTKKQRLAQMVARLLAEPANDLHAAVTLVDVDKRLAAQVVIEVNLVPALGETVETLRDGLDPDGLRVFSQERLGSHRVVVEKQKRRPSGLASAEPGHAAGKPRVVTVRSFASLLTLGFMRTSMAPSALPRSRRAAIMLRREGSSPGDHVGKGYSAIGRFVAASSRSLR